MKKLALILLIIPALHACITEKRDVVVNYVNENDPVPSFSVRTPHDANPVAYTASDFIGKRSLIVFFWTPCGDCRREMPKIHEVWEQFKNDGDFQLVAVSRGESAQTVADYWSDSGYSGMPYYLDPDRSAFAQFANNTVPRLYLIGREGLISHMEIERFSPTQEIIELINEKL